MRKLHLALVATAITACDAPPPHTIDTETSVQSVCDSTRRMRLLELGETVRLVELRANPLKAGESAVFVVEGALRVPADAKLLWSVPAPSDGSPRQTIRTTWQPMNNPRYWRAEVPNLPPGALIVQLAVTETCTWASAGHIVTAEVSSQISTLRGYHVGGAYPGLTQPPATPTGFNAMPDTTSSLLAMWQDVTDEAGYVLDYREKGSSTFQQQTIAANRSVSRVAGLSPGLTYEVMLRAYNDIGASAPTPLIEVELPTPTSPTPETNSAWIEIVDYNSQNITGDGVSPGAYPVPISAPPGPLPFRYEATAAVAYFDENRNGRVDFQPTASPGAPAFPYSKHAMMPTTEVPQAWFLEDSNLLDGSQGQVANIVMYAELPQTYGARAASQHISLHLAFDGQQVQLISVLAGDLLNPYGHLMVSRTVRPISAQFLVDLPRSGRSGRLTGIVEADLEDYEYYSYFDSTGTPAVGLLSYSATVRFHFDSPMVAQ